MGIDQDVVALTIYKCAGCDTVEDVLNVAAGFCKFSGFDSVIYANIPPESFYDTSKITLHPIGDEPDKISFQDIIIGLKSAYDSGTELPYMNFRILETFEPFFRYDPFLQRKGLYSEQDKFNYKPFPGAVFPVHGGKFCHGYFGIITEENWAKSKEGRVIHAVFQILHQRYTHLQLNDAQPGSNLSDREREVIHWLRLGKSNAEISDMLSISLHTVDTYLRRIYKKLDVNTRVGAAFKATVLGNLN